MLQARGDVATGLVTGNLEPIGWGKMEALGILSLFTKPKFGGFGSDFCSGNIAESWKDRGELVRIAAKRAEESMPGRALCVCLVCMSSEQDRISSLSKAERTFASANSALLE